MAFKQVKRTRLSTLAASDLEDEIPNIPDKFVKKFPELREFNRQLNDWWDSVKSSLVRYEDRINLNENNIKDLATEVSANTTRINEEHP